MTPEPEQPANALGENPGAETLRIIEELARIHGELLAAPTDLDPRAKDLLYRNLFDLYL